MALLNCPKCGKKISSFADSCPNCGTSPNAIICQNCKSDDILVSIQTVGETTNGKKERKVQ